MSPPAMRRDVLETAPVIRWGFDALRRWRARQAAKRKEALKAQIVHALERARSRSVTVAYVSEDELGRPLGLSASELGPLLEELVLEGRIHRGIMPRTYTVSRWTPNPRNLYP